jgi:hypothetical protein
MRRDETWDKMDTYKKHKSKLAAFPVTDYLPLLWASTRTVLRRMLRRFAVLLLRNAPQFSPECAPALATQLMAMRVIDTYLLGWCQGIN